MGDSRSLGVGEIAQLEGVCISLNFGGGDMILTIQNHPRKNVAVLGLF